jgi:two-component system, OmpR family, KDP operon response regulator KdpE
MGLAYVEGTYYLRQYLAQLPKQLELAPTRPRHVSTEAGMGYRFMSWGRRLVHPVQPRSSS